MILAKSAIIAAIKSGDIVIDPYDPECITEYVGGNSYDVHLSRHIAVVRPNARRMLPDSITNPGIRLLDGVREESYNDSAKEQIADYFQIQDDGFLLRPFRLYLGSTFEYTESNVHVPYLDGRSSVGRLGISIHATAGRGDVGFRNHWTLEMTVPVPTVVYAGCRIAQLTWHEVTGDPGDYQQKGGATYAAARNPLPMPSGMWKTIEDDRRWLRRHEANK